MHVAQEAPAPTRSRCPRRIAHATDEVRVGLVGFGLYQLAVGLMMAVDPGAFFQLLGPFGVPGDHYVRDLATFELPLGVALLVAVRLRSWRVPVLAFAALHWTLHAINHVADIGAAASPSIGVVDAVLVAAGAVLLGWLLSRAARAERWQTP